ncbi:MULTISPECIES: hypothetical protein [Fusobacterium]|jgi:hypothetical protein|uniref:Uncharacterized protein n=2 Tax=Fusobacterium TaxID=848 RepID=A0A323TXP0_FUSNU|nr:MULTISPECIES: hypothetical protein [Fusobacterium]DAO79200.1 MAG TPA: hypothetical protein [Caudoviricetes sp.]ALQ36230.1 hypothetical protein RN92_10025 [Fusobacterium hwasookii ChDC F206]PCR85672.1 hypothetical protein CQA79_03155 [Fusobacterium nucleatum]PZA04547.1 hypothetical protein DNF10_05585 [Fusobacterium nucleatum]QJX49618.1 hypothetical protein HOO60_01535 [Fusobacterium nucleatum]
MKDKVLTEEAKKILKQEYGKDALKIDKELNELATLSVKRKNYIQAANKGNSKARENYVKITEEIKKIVVQINKKLSKN